MENLNKSTENPKVVIRDLTDLLHLVYDSKEGYQHAAETTKTPELHKFFLTFVHEREVYANELKEHIAFHGGKAHDEEGGVLGGLHRTWITIKDALTGKGDAALLAAIITGEQAAIAKFDECIADHRDHADHLKLLVKQRDGIWTALGEIEVLKDKY